MREEQGFDRLSPNGKGDAMDTISPLSPVPELEAPRDCPLCPRLVGFREELREEHPDWWNAPVPHFGDPGRLARHLRPRPGQAGRQPHRAALHRRFRRAAALRDLAQVRPRRGTLRGAAGRRASARRSGHRQSVKCVPPQNKPTPEEIATCTRTYFHPALAALSEVRVLVALGQIAHDAAVRSVGRTARRLSRSAISPSIGCPTAAS